MAIALNVVGKTIGNFQVLRYVPDRKGKGRFYECLCVCGHTSVRSANSITSRSDNKCRRCPVKDLTGMKFGDLTATKRLGLKFDGTANRPLWLFTCICGGEKILHPRRVTSKDHPVTNCGCRRKQELDARSLAVIKKSVYCLLSAGAKKTVV